MTESVVPGRVVRGVVGRGVAGPGVAGPGVVVPALVVSPDPQHGVAVYARDVAAAIARTTGRDVAVPPAVLDGEDPPARTHLHFTDRLWASSPEAAANRIEQLASRTRLTVTLHDLPQPSDGERNLPRRAQCYARVVAACEGVVVNSRHEALLLEEHTLPDRPTPAVRVGVIPLPVTPAPDPGAGAGAGADSGAGRRPESDGSVAVLGFFYPGKGHAEVVDALAALGPRPGVSAVVLGRPSPGHEGELDTLVAEAADRGVLLEVTGWLEDPAMLERCRRVAVPVATHRHVSASGSIATWVAAGRRPLVPATRYSREMAELRPGTLTLVDGDLSTAIARALDDPASTWIAEDAVTRPDMADTADAYLRWFAERTS